MSRGFCGFDAKRLLARTKVASIEYGELSPKTLIVSLSNA
jgi:hypothetical protein